jgi:hypothetical protein
MKIEYWGMQSDEQTRMFSHQQPRGSGILVFSSNSAGRVAAGRRFRIFSWSWWWGEVASMDGDAALIVVDCR